MAYKAPGKAFRKGISVMEIIDMFPDEASAREWFENVRWPNGSRYCPKCGCCETTPVKNDKPMPYWCKDCRSYFSVRTGTAMVNSRLPLRKWVIALYIMSTNIKGTSSMKLHRDLGIRQSSAWYMAQRIREGWFNDSNAKLTGPVEVDETYIGGLEKNKHRRKRSFGRGTAGKIAVMGAKQRDGKVIARPLGWEPGETYAGFVHETVEAGETVYTDGHQAYSNLKDVYEHGTVKHNVGEYVNGQAHTNGIESFWAMLKRGYHGTYHKMSRKHLHRYVTEFALFSSTRSRRGGRAASTFTAT